MRFIGLCLVMFILLSITPGSVTSGETISIVGRFIGTNNYILVSFRDKTYNVKGRPPEGLKKNDYVEVKGIEREDKEGNPYIWALQIKILTPIKISTLRERLREYLNRRVLIYGEFRGWEGGVEPPPVTRSDWLVKDDTGYIYVVGASPYKPMEDKGKKIILIGILKLSKENIPYIEPIMIEGNGAF